MPIPVAAGNGPKRKIALVMIPEPGGWHKPPGMKSAGEWVN